MKALTAATVLAALVALAAAAKGDRKLRGAAVDKKKAGDSAFMKEVQDEDVKFWTRELGRNLGSGRRLEGGNKKAGKDNWLDEDIEFWTRELGRNLGSGRRQLGKTAEVGAAGAGDEDVEFWTRELGRNLGSGRR